MRLTVSKTPTEELNKFFAVGGIINVATEIIDNNLASIVLTATHPFDDSVLGRVVIKKVSDYSSTLAVVIPEPPKTVSRYRLHGTAFELSIDRKFVERDDAERLKDKFELRARNCMEEDQVALVIEEVQVVDEAAPQ